MPERPKVATKPFPSRGRFGRGSRKIAALEKPLTRVLDRLALGMDKPDKLLLIQNLRYEQKK